MVNGIFKMGGKNIFHVFSYMIYIYIFILQVMVSCWAARAQHRAAVPALYSHLKQFSTQLQQFVWVGRIKNGGSGWRIRTSHKDQDPSQREQDHRPGWKMCTRVLRCITTSRNSNLISKNFLKDSEPIKGCSCWKLWLISSSKICHHKLNNLVKLLPCQSLEWICELRYWEHFSIILFCWQLYPVLLQIFQNLGIWHLLGWNF